MAALVILNFTVNTGNSLIQNKGMIRYADYYFSVIQETASSATEPEKNTSEEKKSKPGTGQILKDIKRLNKKSMTSDCNKRCKKD
ncbi:MAG: hypothetical protein HFI37_07545 [Lachnospiraceae bacterium]|nr:hypothetical protein [Lachnospiraceae bacterium]